MWLMPIYILPICTHAKSVSRSAAHVSGNAKGNYEDDQFEYRDEIDQRSSAYLPQHIVPGY
jgi:hypothetical protein